MEDNSGELVNYIDVASLEWRKAVEVHILGDTPTKTIVIEEEEESIRQEVDRIIFERVLYLSISLEHLKTIFLFKLFTVNWTSVSLFLSLL